jgi:hypothetical protein
MTESSPATRRRVNNLDVKRRASGYYGAKEMKLRAKRFLVVGGLFIVSPLLLLPLINWIGVSIVSDKFKDKPVSFLEFDENCVGIQIGTMGILFFLGVLIAAIGVAIHYFNKIRDRISGNLS